jgi:peptidoglycan/xylan/chitin deacetylase (PgdA/CDA1 family)
VSKKKEGMEIIMENTDKITPSRRLRINRIKKIIVSSVFLLIIFLLLISTGLFIKVISLNKELNNKSKKTIIKEATTKVTTEETTKEDIKKEDTTNTVSESVDGKKLVYLTFDDGPSIYTNEILNILTEYNAKATFFVNGKKGAENEELYKKIISQGSNLGMHSFSHAFEDIYSEDLAFAVDTEKIHEYLYKVTGKDIRIYRFPGGSSTTNTEKIPEYIDYLNRKGYIYFDWNVSSGDARKEKLTEDEIYNNVIAGITGKSESIVLMHDSAAKDTTVKALPKILKKLKEDGYEMIPITDETVPIQHRKN